MRYDLRPNQVPVLPDFQPGTTGTRLIPQVTPLLAGMHLPSRSQPATEPEGEAEPQGPLKLAIPGIDGTRKLPIIERLVFPGDWVVVPQSGYAYTLPGSLVQTPDEENPHAVLRADRKATLIEQFYTTASAIQGVWQRANGPEDVPVVGLRRTKPAYVYGEIIPQTHSNQPDNHRMLDVFGGQFDITPGRWIHSRLLLISEGDARHNSPRIVPVTYLSREFTRWEDGNGRVIMDFGAPLIG